MITLEKQKWLTSLIKQTTATAKVVRIRKSTDERNYDYDKLSTDLLGKHVRIEYYSTTFDRAAGYITGCYKEIVGTVTEVLPGYVTHVVLDRDKCFDPHIGADFKLQVLS